MNTAIAVRRCLIGAGCALALAACGSNEREAGRPAAAARPAATPAAPAAAPDLVAQHGRELIVFRRVRYEGATLNVMTLYADGFVKIDVPNGGAGGAKFVARATPRAVRGVRRAMASTPWRHLSERRVLFDRSGVYFMLHHGGQDYVAMAGGMSPDLKPLVTRLNAILIGDARGARRTVHRWGRI
jgi:hypothetical protein